MIFKLEQNDIFGDLLNILIDFITNDRKQRVVLNGQFSAWASVNAGVPQRSILGPLLFSIYINDLSDNLSSNVKLFADDTSLFSVTHDVNVSARELNDDLRKISNWAFQWKMSFNPDVNKQAQEVIFSRKIKSNIHPPLVFNNNFVSQANSQKHLGITLDFKLTFEEQLLNVFKKVNKTVGLSRKLQNLLPAATLITIYKSLCQTPPGLWRYFIRPSI